ncbi:MAG TPA: 16S rRNA (adenine(1518)-N(6)/adenine(1519)-N(6))-dimethyltransferase RsmA [Ignavibacteria bacterium]|nr:16S rRNA (adenine(1518)-N(6)/adenine(1519)-N(6))-dimethyltransferase RsmA [Ignavibacteria bacterium]HMR40840.1 16S rRNA (adenine(1518)-N(6)/adenine(1519)-N(6))-dimethyltransferase RsmA [Ignavibacteria bacterium]
MISKAKKYELYKPKKFLGQNFLVDENIAKKIVRSLDISENDTVVEIGPGQQALTKHLTGLTKNFYAVELDKSIYEKLQTEHEGKINLIHKDFLKTDLEKDFGILPDSNAKLKIIGNIPYNITTEILFKLFSQSGLIESAVLMMQREVAKRLVSAPDTKDYGILAVQSQFYTRSELLFHVPPTAFFPKPNVTSSVVKFHFDKDTSGLKDKVLFKEIVRESFGQRRKTMRNSLKKFMERYELNENEITGFDFTRRPENLKPSEFIALSNTVSRLLSEKSDE